MDLQAIYDEVFQDPKYNTPDAQADRRYAFALRCVNEWGSTHVTDIGSGRGDFLRLLPKEIDVLSLDLARYHDVAVPFERFDLTTAWCPETCGDTVTCLDVLEHLPEDSIARAISHCRAFGDRLAVTAANAPSYHLGQDLHLTQKPKAFWEDLLSEHYTICDSEDHGTVYYFKCEAP
jgi:hypothetical protein